MLWERFFERRPPDAVWLQRIAETIAALGYKIDSFIAAYAGSQDRPDPGDWFWWRTDTTGAAPSREQPGHASEEEIRDAWGSAYETMQNENG